MSRSKHSAFVVCIENPDDNIDLELNKVYRTLPDSDAEKHQMIRVIDESGEDYLYSASMFLPVHLPKQAADAMQREFGRRSARKVQPGRRRFTNGKKKVSRRVA